MFDGVVMFDPEIDTLYFETPLSMRLFHENSMALPRPFPNSPFHSVPCPGRHEVKYMQMYLPLTFNEGAEAWEFSLQIYREGLVDVLKSMNGLKKIEFIGEEWRKGWVSWWKECVRDFKISVEGVGGKEVLDGIEVVCAGVGDGSLKPQMLWYGF